MTDESFNQRLLQTLDRLVGEESFTRIPNQNKYKHRVYKNGTHEMSVDSSRLIAGRFIGLEMDVRMEGIVLDGRPIDSYWQHMVNANPEINQEIKKFGVEVDKYKVLDPDNNGNGVISSIRVLYQESSEPEDVAKAMIAIQRILFAKMSQYVGSESTSSKGIYLQR